MYIHVYVVVIRVHMHIHVQCSCSELEKQAVFLASVFSLVGVCVYPSPQYLGGGGGTQ